MIAPRQTLPDAADLVAVTEAFFQPGGGLARASAGEQYPFEPRPQQAEMAQAVARALSDAQHLVVEAGTGVGKSFAYLVPLALVAHARNIQVIVSTYTIALQEQLIAKDLPFLHDLLQAHAAGLQTPVPSPSTLGDAEISPPDTRRGGVAPVFTAMLGKGRGNYICFRRLAAAVAGRNKLFNLPGEMDQLAALSEWAMATDTGFIQDITFKLSPSVWEKVRSDSSASQS